MPLPFRPLPLLSLGVACAAADPSAPAAAPGDDSALAQVDAFLAGAAATTPAYRADLRPAGGSADAIPGRRFAVGPLAGPFTYRARTYRELSADERAAVWRADGFSAFLQRARTTAAGAPAAANDPAHPLRITLSAGEMLLARPGAIALPGR